MTPPTTRAEAAPNPSCRFSSACAGTFLNLLIEGEQFHAKAQSRNQRREASSQTFCASRLPFATWRENSFVFKFKT
jgi:hypothetical protein